MKLNLREPSFFIGHRGVCPAVSFKEVFAEPFANTEESTILKKLSGPDKMLEIIDTYWEAQGIKVEKSRLSPKK